MPEIRLYNTLGRSVGTLKPLQGNEFRIYTCGLTVYGEAHVGNLRAYLAQDVLVRVLRHFGYGVKRVMNVTDVGHLVGDGDEGEDKMEVGARREGKTAWDVARLYEERFLADMDRLRMARPDLLVRATETVPEQIAFIQGLEAKGYAYRLDDGIYYDTSKFPSYGEMARLDIEGLQAGARVEMREGKRNITDFALWKFSEIPGKRDMEWESPWGIGYPGWHIECSAIALKTLGEQLDIHAGGPDHIPVHHTNEIAQSEALTGKRLSQVWFHNEFLLIDGGKMSKSLGNVYTLSDLAERGIEPLAFRLFTYSGKYRSKLNFTWEALAAAQASLQRLRALADRVQKEAGGAPAPYVERTEAALADDLNVPEALAVLWELLRADIPGGEKRAYLERFEPVFSLGLLDGREAAEIPAEIRELAGRRQEARGAKDWAEADRLRAEIEGKGYALSDVVGQEMPEITPR